MKPFVTVQLEDDAIRFTPDGRIAIVDAIRALSDSDCPCCIWEDLINNHPQLSDMCSKYTFQGDESVAVANSENWNVIQSLLLEQLMEGNGF
jgi:hypothetical protein